MSNSLVFSGGQSRSVLCASCAAALFLAAGSAAGQVTGRNVFPPGFVLPGVEAGTTLSGISRMLVDADGNVSFRGFLTGPDVADDNFSGIWSEGGGGGLRKVFRGGDQAAGLPAGVNYNITGDFIDFYAFGEPASNRSGQTAFRTKLTGTDIEVDVNDQAIFSDGGGGAVSLMARRGSPAPGVPGNFNFNFFSREPAIGNGGHVAFHASADDGVTGVSGIWTGRTPSEVAPVVLSTDQMPGQAPGATFILQNFDFGQFAPVVNRNGTVAFRAQGGTGGGIYKGGGGTPLSEVAASTRQAPGTDAGVSFTGLAFPIPTINDAGHVSFFGRLTGPGVTAANDQGLWSEGGGNGLRLVAREGDAAPGTGPGVNFRVLGGANNQFYMPQIGGGGHSIFYSTLIGTDVTIANDTGVWSEGGGMGLRLLGREGDQAPGLDAGVTFGSFGPAGFNINARGQAVFTNTLAGTGISPANDISLWTTDAIGNPFLFLREGDLFDVNDDPLISDLRTISLLFNPSGVTGGAWSGGEDGRRSNFNDAGQMALFLGFTDGTTGSFVVTVPGPGGAALLACFGALAGVRRRRS